MSLANYDVKQELIKLTQNFLSIDYQFSELKDLLTNKKPISSIHEQITKKLHQIRDSEKSEAISRLENSAFQQQISEDENELMRDLQEKRKDLNQRNILNEELQHKKILKAEYERQLLIYTVPTNTHVHPDTPTVHHHTPSVSVTLTPNPNVHTHSEASISRQDLESRLYKLNRRISEITKELQDLDLRRDQREIRSQNREKRSLARNNYLAKKELTANPSSLLRFVYDPKKIDTITETLSSTNQRKLTSNIEKELKTIEQQCSSLISKAEQFNYSVFLEQLEPYLQTARRPFQEIEALRTISVRMKDHLSYQKKAANIQLQLNSAIRSIGENKNTLERLNSKLNSLRLANPNLTKKNVSLEEENKKLSESHDAHIKTRNKLIFPTLLSSGLSLLFSIPLILTLTGVIPYVIAPALLLTLVIAPPALLLLTGLGFGIAAMIYAVKAYMNNSAIQSNQETIENNRQQMGTNLQEIYTLENQTIPNLQKTQSQNESTKNRLEDELQHAEALAEQALKQAKEIEPYIYSSTPFFNPEVTVHKHPSETNTLVNPSAPPYEETLYPVITH